MTFFQPNTKYGIKLNQHVCKKILQPENKMQNLVNDINFS